MPTEPDLYVEKECAPPAVVPVQHKSTDVPVGSTAQLAENNERGFSLNILVLRCPLQALVRHDRPHRGRHGGKVHGCIQIGPRVHGDLDGNDAFGGDERIGSRKVDVVDLGIDVAVAREFLHEHRNTVGDNYLAVEDREDVLAGGDGLGAGVGDEDRDTGKERVHEISGTESCRRTGGCRVDSVYIIAKMAVLSTILC